MQRFKVSAKSSLHQHVTQCLRAFISMGLGWFMWGSAGLAPAAVFAQGSSPSPGRTTTTPSRNPPISAPQIQRYARAVLEIEAVRLRFYQQASQALRGKALPTNTCLGNQRSNIPAGLESICSDYLSASRLIIDKYQISPEQFNAITLRSRSDLNLMAQIQAEFDRLRSLRPESDRSN